MGLLAKFNRIAGENLGFMVKRRSGLYQWQKQSVDAHESDEASLPSGASDYLRSDNPRLLELERRYKIFDPSVTAPAVWVKDMVNEKILRFFRSDSPYVWQNPGHNSNELAYALSYFWLRSGSSKAILDALPEDDLFGALTLQMDGRLVSRDLLDSVREIEFLQVHAGLGESAHSVLDIGAGYGRLAHRLNQITPESVAIYATDAFPQSTFLSEYYLKFRGASRAKVIPLDEFDAFLASTPIEIATNIHSFSECTPAAIAWWVERLAKHKVRYLMIVPNGEAHDGPIPCETNAGDDIEAIIARFGYALKVREPRHAEPLVQRYGLDPAQFNLFELG